MVDELVQGDAVPSPDVEVPSLAVETYSGLAGGPDVVTLDGQQKPGPHVQPARERKRSAELVLPERIFIRK